MGQVANEGEKAMRPDRTDVRNPGWRLKVAVLVAVLSLLSLSLPRTSTATSALQPDMPQLRCVEPVANPALTVTLRIDPATAPETLDAIVKVLERRAAFVSSVHCALDRTNDGRIVISMTPLDDFYALITLNELSTDEIVTVLTSRGFVEFIDPQGDPLEPGMVVRTSLDPQTIASPTAEQPATPMAESPIYPTIASSADVTRAITSDQGACYPGVAVRFNEDAAQRLLAYSQDNFKNILPVVVDKTVLITPTINAELTGDEILLYDMTLSEGRMLVVYLASGPLPDPLPTVVEVKATQSDRSC